MESDGDDTQLDDTELASMYIISYKKCLADNGP